MDRQRSGVGDPRDHPTTVYELIDTGELTTYKIGRTIRLRGQDLQEYLDRSRIQPGDLRHLYPEERGAA